MIRFIFILMLLPLLCGAQSYLDILPDEIPFSPGETGPAGLIIHEPNSPEPSSNYKQTITLHPGWNLVSWHIVPPDPTPQNYIQMIDILPGPPSWLDGHGQVYTWEDDYFYYPDNPSGSANWEWDLNYAYYINMENAHTWNDFEQRPLMQLAAVEDFEPSTAWTHDETIGSPYASYWFFLGYAAPGYCKLASVPDELPPNQYTDDGDPDHFTFEGPFHKLIWSETTPFDVLELKIIKDDFGRAYIPDPDPAHHDDDPIDQIGVLEPGKGYFLGFSDDGPYDFEGWQNWPQWQDVIQWQSSPNPKGNEATTASGGHFSFNKYTHWSYPVYIDTVDLNECPMETGDQIGVFDGDRCVGAAAYYGEFPMLVTCWEDDKATPTEVDGYIDGNPMTFIWYDQSENAEIEFVPPPMTASKEEDDRVAPQYAGFGMGLYAYRSFMEGTSGATYLPKHFSLRQNYPNPFNSSTVIPLELPQRSRVTIDLFDVCGRLVWTHNAGVQNAGWPQLHFHASNLASGVYFYRVTATGLERGGRYQDVGKMLLLK